MKQLICILLAISVGGCTSTTVITSEPGKAKVYLNGENAGYTPYTVSDRKIVGSATAVTLKKDGCDDFSTLINRNEQIHVGALVGGIFVLVPFLWIMGYKPTHHYEMACG